MRHSPDRSSWVTRVGVEWQEAKQEKWTRSGCCLDPQVLDPVSPGVAWICIT